MTTFDFEVATLTLNPAIDRTVTIPNFTPGAVNRVQDARSRPGGKGVNVAAALADFGHHVAATGFLGRENSGSFAELFAAKRITDRFVRIAGQTRIGIKVTDPERRQTTDIDFPGAAPLEADLAALDGALSELSAIWFVLAGSLPPDVPTDIYRELICALKERGCKVALDASSVPLLEGIEAQPHVIKPNIHELEALLGAALSDEAAVINAARELTGRGIPLVVVSMGQQGACFATADQVLIARASAEAVRSTVGAGDAMVAGIIAAQLGGLALQECAQLATAFSLDVLTREDDSVTSRESIEATARKIEVEERE